MAIVWNLLIDFWRTHVLSRMSPGSTNPIGCSIDLGFLLWFLSSAFYHLKYASIINILTILYLSISVLWSIGKILYFYFEFNMCILKYRNMITFLLTSSKIMIFFSYNLLFIVSNYFSHFFSFYLENQMVLL